MDTLRTLAELAAKRSDIQLLRELRARLSPEEYSIVLLQAHEHVTQALAPNAVDLRLAGMALAAAAAMFSAALVEWTDIAGGGRRRN